MPRYDLRHDSARLFRGNELSRLMGMSLLALVVLVMMLRTQNPETWTLFTKSREVPRVKAEDLETHPVGAATGNVMPGKASRGAPAQGANQLAQADAPATQPVVPTTEETVAKKPTEASDEKAAAPSTAAPSATASDAESKKHPADLPPAEFVPSESRNAPTPGTQETNNPPLKETPGTSGKIVYDPLQPTGPTDDDPDEWEEARGTDLSAISDGSLGIEAVDMPAYRRLVRWIDRQSPELLKKRARADLLYAHFTQSPEKFRGRLVHLQLSVRRAVVHEHVQAQLGVDKLYEFWGMNEESRGRLYVIVTTMPPVGMPIGPDINVPVRFDGYFFKLQGYFPAIAKPGDKPSVAPALVGRLEMIPSAKTPPANTENYLWYLVGGLMLLFAVIRLSFAFRPRRPVRASIFPKILPDEEEKPVDINTWLDQVTAEQAADGNNSAENDESIADEDWQRPNGVSLPSGEANGQGVNGQGSNGKGSNGQGSNGQGGKGQGGSGSPQIFPDRLD